MFLRGTGGGAGIDKTPRAGFYSGVEKARKCRRFPTVHCALCSAAYIIQGLLFQKQESYLVKDYLIDPITFHRKYQIQFEM